MATITKQQTFDRDEDYGRDIKITQRVIYQSTAETLTLDFGTGNDIINIPVFEFNMMVDLVKKAINSK